MFKQYKKKSGFTLIELVIVIAVIGVLSTIAIPNFMSWRTNMYVKAAARDLYSSMQNARMIAIKTNSTIAIIFDTINSRYYLCDDPGADTVWNGTNDNIGTGDNNIIRTYDLTSYKSGVHYGHGNISGNSVGGGAFPADGISYPNSFLSINSQGVSNNLSGYVYVTNRDGNRAYAVGTLTSGVVKLLKWDGGNWQ